jgi:hypothetical protein
MTNYSSFDRLSYYDLPRVFFFDTTRKKQAETCQKK